MSSKLLTQLNAVKPVEVTVQTMANRFVLLVVLGTTIRELKTQIKEHCGTPPHLQELFLVEETEEDAKEETEPLTDESHIVESCLIVLIVKRDWTWSKSLNEFEKFKISDQIATKIETTNNYDHCLMVDVPMTSGIHTISLKLGGRSFYCGVVRDGSDCNTCYATRENQQGWFINTWFAALCGNGKNDGDFHEPDFVPTDRNGTIFTDEVLTMRVDLEAGTLKFWVDGKPRGNGYTSGVSGPLRWAVSTFFANNHIEIVSTPPLT